METPTNFKQDDYTMTKITINKGQTNTAKKWKYWKYWKLPSSKLKLISKLTTL